MRFDVVPPQELSPEDIAAWESLRAASPRLRNPFLSSDWVRATAEVAGPDQRMARVVIARERRSARPLAFLPMRLAGATALPVGSPMSDYQAMVAAPDALIDPRRMVRAAGVQRFDFNHLIVGEESFAPFVRGRAESLIIDIAEGYDAYAAAKRADSDILKDTAKKHRKLEREHGEVVFTPLSTSADDFETLIAWKRAQYRTTRQTDIFDAQWPLDLLRRLHARQDRRFRGALFTLHAGGRLAAAHLALMSESTLHAWFIAHDADFARCSPGVILIDQMLRWGAAHGVVELDLGPGDYRFKHQLANRILGVEHGVVGLASPVTLVREAEYRLRNVAEALPLGRVSHWPGKAMRRVDLWRGLR